MRLINRSYTQGNEGHAKLIPEEGEHQYIQQLAAIATCCLCLFQCNC